MLDISSLIQNVLGSNWSITNPALADFLWKMDEFDPKWGRGISSSKSIIAQVLFENYPDRKIYISNIFTGIMYKVIHSCRITIYLRPLRYDDTTVEATKTTFFNIKSEIDRILAKCKFSISGVTNLEMTASGWNDGATVARGRGTKSTREPIVWESRKVVTAIYYTVG